MQIEEITKWAKEFLMEDGTHAPTLFIETDKPQIIIASIKDMPDTPEDRRGFFFSTGRRLGSELTGQNIREAALIVMGWASPQAMNEPPPTVRPSQDPNRIELLMISWLRVFPDQKKEIDEHTKLVQVLRGPGKTVDLVEMSDTVNVDPLHSQLVLLLAGFRSAMYSNEELAKMVQEMNAELPNTGAGMKKISSFQNSSRRRRDKEKDIHKHKPKRT